MCDHRLCDSSTGLRCLLEAHPLHPNGHSYEASAAPDRHIEDTSDGEAGL